MEPRYGTSDIARLCGVAASTVAKWIDDGRLPSHTTAGGHRRVVKEDLLSFMEAQRFPIPPELKTEAVILVVDDNPADRALAVRAARKGCPTARVEEAADGFEAGQKAAMLRPDLILLDLGLAGVNGLRVCERIRADPDLRGVRILTMSSNDGIDVARSALESGAEGFVSKNTGWDTVANLVAGLMRKVGTDRP